MGNSVYDLQAPSKNLYPVNTPLRNRIPRVGGGTGLATNWRVVSAIAGSGFDSMPWVPEGQRTAAMSYTTTNKAASYVTLGEEDYITYEARNAGMGFENLQASMVVRLLQKMMLKEECAIMGGNTSLALGTTGTPTASASGAGTLPSLTYSVICVALTLEGYLAWKGAGSSLVTGIVQTKVITGSDGLTYTLNGGCGQKSANQTQASGGSNINCSVAPVSGAVAYAWYIAAAGAEKLEAVTTLNSIVFSAPLAGTGQLASALTAADYSQNSTYAFDGLLSTGFKAGSGAYIKTLATGTPGTGTVLTASGRGSCVEIDTMLQAMWDQSQVSPSVIFANSQQIKDLTTKCLTGASSAPLLQFFADPQRGAAVLAAGGGIEFYFNPFSMKPGGQKIPIMIHPTLPAGTIMAWCEDLPSQYVSNQVPNVAEVKTRQDYYQLNYPQVKRRIEVGVYAEEVLAIYAPFAIGVLNNIANG